MIKWQDHCFLGGQQEIGTCQSTTSSSPRLWNYNLWIDTSSHGATFTDIMSQSLIGSQVALHVELYVQSVRRFRRYALQGEKSWWVPASINKHAHFKQQRWDFEPFFSTLRKICVPSKVRLLPCRLLWRGQCPMLGRAWIVQKFTILIGRPAPRRLDS